VCSSDLITAVAVGLILAGFVTARWMEGEELKGVTAVALPGPGDGLNAAEEAELSKHNGAINIISLRGRFSYASARELVKRLGPMAAHHKAIIYDFTNAAHIDTSAAIALDELFKTAVSAHVHCLTAGLSGTAEATLKTLGVLDVLAPANIQPTRLDAIRRAGELAVSKESPPL